MVDTVKELRIFIASPIDCDQERKIVRLVCAQDPTISTIIRKNKVSLTVLGWEDVKSAAN